VTACAVGPLFSTSAVLVVVGVMLPLALLSYRRRAGRQLMWNVAGVAAAILAFGVSYWLSYRFAVDSDVMVQFWRGAYLDISSIDAVGRSAELVRRLVWGLFIGPPPRFVWWVWNQQVD